MGAAEVSDNPTAGTTSGTTAGTTPVPPPQPPPTITLDPDGDLLLRVGTELPEANPTLFKVCSAALRRSSPVWKAMLFGRFAESKPAEGGDWVVDLPDDNPETTRLLLDIIHGAFANVPVTLSLDLLCGVLVVADKYDLIHLLRPYANAWAEVVRAKSLPGSYQGDSPLLSFTGSFHLERIYAAWELGCDALVSKDMVEFIFNVSKRGTSFYLQESLLELGSHHGPPDLLDIVSKHRLSLIQSFLDFYHTQVDSRMPTASAQGCIRPDRYYSSFSNPHVSDLCNAVVLGGIWQYLHKTRTGFLPRRAEEYSHSARYLIDTLRAMFNQLRPFSDEHKVCRPIEKFAEWEMQIRADKRYCVALQPHHREQMRKHRERCGLSLSWINAV